VLRTLNSAPYNRKSFPRILRHFEPKRVAPITIRSTPALGLPRSDRHVLGSGEVIVMSYHKRQTPITKRMAEDMLVRNLATRTIDSYTYHVDRFARHFGKQPEDLGPSRSASSSCG
jgi:hypothetical protein